MRDNLELAPATWHDFYAVTGFAPGTDVIGCSGGGTRICLFEGDQPPEDCAVRGWQIYPGTGFRVNAASAWVRGNAGLTLCGLQEVEAGGRPVITPFIGDIMGGGQNTGGQQGAAAIELTFNPSSGEAIAITAAGTTQFISVLLTADASVDGVQLMLPAGNVPGRRVVITSANSAGVNVTTSTGEAIASGVGLEIHDGWAIEFVLVSAAGGIWARVS